MENYNWFISGRYQKLVWIEELWDRIWLKTWIWRNFVLEWCWIVSAGSRWWVEKKISDLSARLSEELSLLGKVVTGDDESWVFQYNPETKCQRLQDWKKLKCQISLPIILLSSFGKFVAANVLKAKYLAEQIDFASWKCAFPHSTFSKVIGQKTKYHYICLIWLYVAFSCSQNWNFLKGSHLEPL
jgi:hypothetical protein